MPDQLPFTTITFPELRLHPSAGHKLRGYFGGLFRDRSPLLHNHYDDGSLRHRYPLVQYKVVRRVPTLVGLAEGATLLTELFLQIHELELDGERLPLYQKNIRTQRATVGVTDALFEYRFETLWMALNQENFARYRTLSPPEQTAMLDAIARQNIIAFCKGISYFEEGRILTRTRLEERATQFKNQRMLAFAGTLTTNMQLPEGIGLGKSVARGYGTLRPL